MGRILLCTGKYAKKPYHISNLCANVYSVEELCYLFASNPFMIDHSIMDQNLITWLDAECGLTELSHKLTKLLGKGCQPGNFVHTILSYVNYCTPEDIKKIDETLLGNAGLGEYERRKRQADFLLKNGRYQMAITEYDALSRQLPDTESALRPVIFHNMGVAYAGFFLFGMAAKYFKKAYDATGEKESGICFLFAKRKSMEEGEYIAFIAEHGEYHELSLMVEKKIKESEGLFQASEENRRLSALRFYKEEGNVASYYDEIDKIISGLKDEYRQMVEA